MATLHSLLLSKVLSEGMAKKTSSGLNFEQLSLAYARSETERFTSMQASERNLGNRKSEKISKKVINALSEYFQKVNCLYYCASNGVLYVVWLSLA